MRRHALAPLSALALSTLALAGCGDDGGDAAGPNPFLSGRPIAIAHGGGQGLGPDHTLHTYGLAVDAGTDVLELDVHLSADGHVIVMHDETVDRLTDGTGLIKEMTLDALKALDAGHAWSPDGGATFPERGRGHRIPTMDEVFEAFPDAWYVIEIKQVTPSMVDPFLAVLDAYGMRERSLVASFSVDVMEEVRAEAPDLLTSFSEAEATDFFFLGASQEATYVPPAKVLQLPPTFSGIPVLTPEFLAKANRFELLVHAWTINDRAQMDELLGIGVLGLITDFPDRARDAIDDHVAGR